jgi:hypothetical protein
MSKILAKVFAEFIEREERGVKKYGTTMDRKDLSLDEWIQHLKEELLDAILYLEKIQTIYDSQRPSDYQKANSRNDESVNTDREVDYPRASL